MATIVSMDPSSSLMKQVFIIQSAVPVMTDAPVVARLCRLIVIMQQIMVAEGPATMVVIPILMLLMA